ncbi:hypothetical protein [Eubacterium limosum]|uniref:hypothetical protein n=1 Tax=Eubacterium limosum TaxID=1736 RepID=UPI00371F785F
MDKTVNIRVDQEIIQKQYNAETEAALQETEDIINGKIQTEKYDSARELFDILDSELSKE